MIQKDYNCRVIYRPGERMLKITCKYPVKGFVDGIKIIPSWQRHYEPGIWFVLATEGNLHKVLCLAGEHYKGSAVYDTDGQEMPILEPIVIKVVKCPRCGEEEREEWIEEHLKGCR